MLVCRYFPHLRLKPFRSHSCTPAALRYASSYYSKHTWTFIHWLHHHMMLYRSSGLSISLCWVASSTSWFVRASLCFSFISCCSVFILCLVLPVLVQSSAFSFSLISVHLSKGAARFAVVFSMFFLRASIFHLDHQSLVIYSSLSGFHLLHCHHRCHDHSDHQ